MTPTILLRDDFVRSLPGDPREGGGSRQVSRALYSRVDPTPVRTPRLVGWCREVAALLELPWGDDPPDDVVAALAGNGRFEGSVPYAARYGGHQFGSWAGQLGDGRAITLGERVTSTGDRWELQLKGAGPTPYSRRADGRAVLRSSVREFLCSEAMHHLGVPTTRALSLVATGDEVERDMFYDGHPQREPGAIVCRVAPSFLRFGSFEILRARDEVDLLRDLADYTIARFFPEIDLGDPGRVGAWFAEVARRTGALVAWWMRVGFVHGVMNTDNMSVLGLTLDYGPYGWLDVYDPRWTPNTSDADTGRYRYEQQPAMGLWNVSCLATALRPLVSSAEVLHQGIGAYREAFNAGYRRHMAARLGLDDLRDDDDHALLGDLLALMESVETDMTLLFRALGDVSLDVSLDDRALAAPLDVAWYGPQGASEPHQRRVADWLRRYARRVRDEGVDEATWRGRMRAANPRYVLRNYLCQQAIDAAEQGDDGEVRALLDVMRRPYDEQPGREAYAARRPDWARSRPGCSALSCSS